MFNNKALFLRSTIENDLVPTKYATNYLTVGKNNPSNPENTIYGYNYLSIGGYGHLSPKTFIDSKEPINKRIKFIIDRASDGYRKVLEITWDSSNIPKARDLYVAITKDLYDWNSTGADTFRSRDLAYILEPFYGKTIPIYIGTTPPPWL